MSIKKLVVCAAVAGIAFKLYKNVVDDIRLRTELLELGERLEELSYREELDFEFEVLSRGLKWLRKEYNKGTGKTPTFKEVLARLKKDVDTFCKAHQALTQNV